MKNIEGITFLSVKTKHLYFVCTTRYNVSPVLILEFLQELVKILKDYVGVINEEIFRENFPMIYEILDEVLVHKL